MLLKLTDMIGDYPNDKRLACKLEDEEEGNENCTLLQRWTLLLEAFGGRV